MRIPKPAEAYPAHRLGIIGSGTVWLGQKTPGGMDVGLRRLALSSAR